MNYLFVEKAPFFSTVYVGAPHLWPAHRSLRCNVATDSTMGPARYGWYLVSLNPKKVLVTGGSQGLGLALATLLASRGAHVVICSRSEAKLELALRKIETFRQQEKQHLSYVVADVSTFAAASAALKDCPISIDTVFCCAGAATPGYFLDQTEAEFDKGISLIYKTALSTAHVCMLTLTHTFRLRHYS